MTRNVWLGSLAIVTTVLLSACGTTGKQVATGRGDDNTDTNAVSTTEPVQNIDSDQETTEPESEEPEPEPEGADIEVVEAGFSVYEFYDGEKRATAAAVLENEGGGMATFFEVVFSFKDADGKPVGTETSYVQAVDGGGTTYVGVRSVDLSGTPEDVEVAVVYDADGFMWGEGFIVPVEVESLKPEEYGDGVEIRGTAENTSGEILEFVSVDCALRSNGKIVGYASGYLDTMVDGASITWDANGPVPADAAECAASVHV